MGTPDGGSSAPSGADECSVSVAVRVRPLNAREKNSKQVVRVQSDIATVFLAPGGGSTQPHRFTFDHVWDSTDRHGDDFADQKKVYGDVGRKVLEVAFKGYNACIFAYGQTGSGKSFCMMGADPEDDELAGIIPRLCRDIFERVAATSGNSPEAKAQGAAQLSYKVEASYLEIYQERVKCLLNPKKDNLRVREHPTTGPYVEDLTKLVVNRFDAILRLLEDGNKVRHVASTQMNDASSRSHAIFTLTLTQTKKYEQKNGNMVSHDTVSKVNLVDLAGSERAKSTGATGQTLAEGAQINKSLSTLGLVISGLADLSKKKRGGVGRLHIPFRDSTLTWLLKDNLSGNSKTFMISTISPAEINHDETLSTLRYADRAKSIVTKATVNEDPNTKLIRQLREEVAKYKQQIADYETKLAERKEAGGEVDTEKQVEEATPSPRIEDDMIMTTPRVPMNPGEARSLRNKLQAIEKLMSEAGRTWEEKEELSRQELQAHQETMQELGITVKVDKSQPHLVNLVPCGEWIVRYLAKDETLVVGSAESCDLLLSEDGTQPEHFKVSRDGDDVQIVALGEAVVQVQDIDGSTTELTASSAPYRLEHGCCVEAGEAYMRFVDPQASEDRISKQKKMQREVRSRSRAWSGNDRGDTALPPSMSPREDEQVVKQKEEEMRCRIQAELRAEHEREREEMRQRLHGQWSGMATPRKSLKSLSPELKVSQAPVVSQKPVIPMLKLGEVPREASPGQPFSAGSRPSTAVSSDMVQSLPQTARLIGNYQSNDHTLKVYKHGLVFLGPEGGGKTSILRCLEKEPGFFSKKGRPTVRPTVGVEVEEMKVAIEREQVELQVIDTSGHPSYTAVIPFALPDARCIFAIVWNLAERFDEQEIKQWLNLAHSLAPGSPVVILCTHRDLCRERDEALQKILNDVTAVISSHLMVLAGDAEPTLIVGTFAVSCKSRTVQRSGKVKAPMRFKDMLEAIAQVAKERCVADPEFPNGEIPSSAISLAKRIVTMRTSGTWTINSAEFKAIAAQADPKYLIDLKELGRVTHLLHCWRVLLHFSGHPCLRRQVFSDPSWLLSLVGVVFSFCHFQCVGSSDDPRSIDAADLQFVPSEVVAKDHTNSLSKGILTVPLAMTVFRKLLTAIRRSEKDVTKCLQLLLNFDLLYPVLGPPDGSCITPTTPLTSPTDPQNPNLVYLLPGLFPDPAPAVLPALLPELMDGVRRTFTFVPSLPRNFFPRLMVRVARCVNRLYVGKVDDLNTSPFHLNCFWGTGAWIQDTCSCRALLWADGNAVHIATSSACEERNSPSRLLLNGIGQAIRSLAAEYRGIKVAEWAPCVSPGCRYLFEVAEESIASLHCTACDEVHDTQTLLLTRRANVAEAHASALEKVLSDCNLSEGAIARVRSAAASWTPELGLLSSEPIEEDEDTAQRILEALALSVEAPGEEDAVAGDERERAIEAITRFQATGAVDEAIKGEWALGVVTTAKRLREEAEKLDLLVEVLTVADNPVHASPSQSPVAGVSRPCSPVCAVHTRHHDPFTTSPPCISPPDPALPQTDL
eukprot:Sspe_Gene.12519::Locus_4273_Transcript_2_2_Confidence_0.667_Length_4872::g.12519::m.12519/K10392/KIF1; kinesin family member 1